MKQFMIFILFLCSTTVFAQDVIVKKDGSTILCRVVELTSSEIVYKKWSNLKGSNYVMNRTDASAINYQNGKMVNLSEATNLYKPYNQNDGVQKYNDKALLSLDYASSNPYKKVKKLKMIGWVGGAVLATGGLITFVAGGGVSESNVIGAGLGIGAVVWTSSFLLIAQQTKNNIDNKMNNMSFFQYDFKLENGSSISASVDMISDSYIGDRTIGLGFRYNF